MNIRLQSSRAVWEYMAVGKLIVFTGPSGVGKGTLLRSLLRRHPDLSLSVSATTRSPRPGEINGQDYYFLSRSQFCQMIESGELLEWAEFAGNLYGTPRNPVEEAIAKGKWVVLEIELQGARQIRKNFPGAFQIFILPPSIEVLEHRLRRRGHDTEESISLRLQRAYAEIEAVNEFDVQVVNDDVEMALDRLESALFSLAEC